MRVAVIGAGAIGCYLCAKLVKNGVEVTLMARGTQLEAIRRTGIKVVGQEPVSVMPRVVRQAADIGSADLVICCVKAHSMAGVAGDVRALIGEAGIALPAVNGLPWWYGEEAGGPLAGIALHTVDPGGAIRARIGPGRTVGCVVYLRSEVVAPGTIAYGGGRGLILGEPDGSMSKRLERVARLLQGAGIATQTTADIRAAVWNKLFGNVALNPLSALTGLATDRLLADVELTAFLRDVLLEAQSVAQACGCRPDSDADSRIEVMGRLGAFRTSMLQDAEAGRPLEIDAIVGAVVEAAALLGVRVPATRRLNALIGAFAESRGLRPARPAGQ